MQLLFEKLSHTSGNWRWSNKGQKERLTKSVLEQLRRILATQNYFDAADDHEADVLSFGVPRMVDFDASNTDDMARLTRQVEKAIRSFEPRLINPRLELQSDQVNGQLRCFQITGLLQLDDEVEHVIFPLTDDLTLS